MCLLKLHFIITIFNLTAFNSCVLEATGLLQCKETDPILLHGRNLWRTTVMEQTYSLCGHKHLPWCDVSRLDKKIACIRYYQITMARTQTH